MTCVRRAYMCVLRIMRSEYNIRRIINLSKVFINDGRGVPTIKANIPGSSQVNVLAGASCHGGHDEA